MNYIIFDNNKALELKSVWVKSIEQRNRPLEYKVSGWGIFTHHEPTKIEIGYEFHYGDCRQSFYFRSTSRDEVMSKWKELIESINSSNALESNTK
jgi:hypothetical protein